MGPRSSPTPLSLFRLTGVLSLMFLCSLFSSKSFAAASNNPRSWIKPSKVEFMENKGQMLDMNHLPAPYLLYKAEAPGVDLYITDSGLSYVFYAMNTPEKKWFRWKRNGETERDEEESLRYEKIDMVLKGASIKKENIETSEPGTALYHFLKQPLEASVRNVKKYNRVLIKEVYPGIDWVLYQAEGSGFKYDFIVHRGADASRIQIEYHTLQPVVLGPSGAIRFNTLVGSMEERAPYSFLAGSKAMVETRFDLLYQNKQKGLFVTGVGFLGSTGKLRVYPEDLVIDPQLVWSTFVSGNSFEGTTAVDSDSQGNVYITGYGASSNYPVLNSGTYFQSAASIGFITKFDNNGVMLWSTYYGTSVTTAYLQVDPYDNLFVCGNTTGSLLPTFNSNTYFQSSNAGGTDAFITKFDNQGTILWSTYYGGTGPDAATSVSSDMNGNVFLVGTTTSSNFPLQNAGTYFEGNFLSTPNAFIIKFTNTGSRLWATYFKGLNAPVVKNDAAGNVYVSASSNSTNVPLYNPGPPAYYQSVMSGSIDAVMAKFDNSGNQLWTTYYGGNGFEQGLSIDTDKSGNVFLCGYTTSTNLPLQNAGTFFQPQLASTTNPDMFISKFSSSGALAWATYFGGSRMDVTFSTDNVEVDTCGNCYVAFNTTSRNMLTQVSCNGGYYKSALDTTGTVNNADIFISCFSNNGVYKWGTYFGGDGNDFRSSMCIDYKQNMFLSGEWCFAVNPLTYTIVAPAPTSYTQSNLFSDDVYISKFVNANTGPNTFSYGTVCVSDTLTLPQLGSGFLSGGTFSAGNGLSIQAQNGAITPSLSTPGTYTIQYVSQPCNCNGVVPIVTGTSQVTILPSPLLSISGATSVCVGETRTYLASGASSYSWNNGLQSPSFTITSAVQGALNYTLTGTSGNGCVSKKTLNIQVSKCVGWEETMQAPATIQLFPNPSNGSCRITGTTQAQLHLYDATGKLLKSLELNTVNGYQVNVEALKPGLYFLRSQSDGGDGNYKLIVLE